MTTPATPEPADLPDREALAHALDPPAFEPDPDNLYGHLREEARATARRVLPHLAAQSEAEPARYRIEGTWLAREVDHCTCNGGTPEANGAHEPGCGLEPEVNLSTLPGWNERDGDTVRVSRPVVPHGPKRLSENAATADYFREVVRKIDGGYADVGGSNVTATVRKLLLDTADALAAVDAANEEGAVES